MGRLEYIVMLSEVQRSRSIYSNSDYHRPASRQGGLRIIIIPHNTPLWITCTNYYH